MVRSLALAASLLCAAGWAQAQAENYPTRPISVVIPFTAGGASDVIGRYLGERLSKTLGQPMVVENKPGASGSIAVMAVKNAPADGYTVLLASSSPAAVNPAIMKDLPYDIDKDLKPVSGLTRVMNMFVVPAASPFRTLQDLVDASTKGRDLSVGTYSEGYRLAVAWFGMLSGGSFTNIPYKGGSQMFADLMGGQLDWAFADVAGVSPLVRSGQLRALAVTGDSRHENFPDIPTVRESGYEDYVNYAWTSYYVRSETPDAIVRKLEKAVHEVLASDDAAAFAKRTEASLMPLPPAEMRKLQVEETNRYRRIQAAAND